MAAQMEQSGAGRPTASGGAKVSVQLVPFDRPWDWLAAGWRDLWKAPGISLGYGAFATAIGFVLTSVLALTGYESLVPVLAGGFMLVAPLLAVGLYETSRRLGASEPVTFAVTFEAMRQSASRLGLLAALLLFLYLVWVRIAFMLLALFLGTSGLPPVREFTTTLLFTPHGLGLLIVGTAVGALLAAVAFTMTVISIPLLMDRRVDVFTAIVASGEAVAMNPRPLALWAALIAGFIALGVATIGAGLVFVFPLLGHATWHAYRDLVAAQPNED